MTRRGVSGHDTDARIQLNSDTQTNSRAYSSAYSSVGAHSSRGEYSLVTFYPEGHACNSAGQGQLTVQFIVPDREDLALTIECATAYLERSRGVMAMQPSVNDKFVNEETVNGPSSRAAQAGFSLIELVMAITVLGIALTVFSNGLQSASERAVAPWLRCRPAGLLVAILMK